jgi:cell growth-regulating nucleolar protein
MVSFTCNHCQDVVKKPKVQGHANTCGSYSFTCVDCMHVFDLNTIKAHTSCVSEEDKYQGKWKQKLSSGNNGGGEAPRGIERPPRAPMNDLSSSDDNDDDWVKTSNKKSAPVKKAAAAASAVVTHRKHPRPGVSPSSDDEEEGVHSHVRSTTPPAKKPKTAAASSSASATPKTRPKTPVQEAKLVKDKEVTKGGEEEGEAVPHLSKDTPLLLPRSTTSTDCIVPSFVLGTCAEVADIVKDVLAEQGVTSLRSKDLAVALVDRYAKRIAKSVRHAVDTAVELGSLKVDGQGHVALA